MLGFFFTVREIFDLNWCPDWLTDGTDGQFSVNWIKVILIIQSPENLNVEIKGPIERNNNFSFPLLEASSLYSEQKLNLGSCLLIKNLKQTFRNFLLLPVVKRKSNIFHWYLSWIVVFLKWTKRWTYIISFSLAIKSKVDAFLILSRLKVRQYWGNFRHKNILSIREDVITFRHLNDGKDFKPELKQ